MNRKSSLLHAFCSLALFLAGVSACPAAYQVYIGGFINQEQLLDRPKWAFVADNCDGYFNHPDGLRKMPLAQRQQISALFKNKAVIAEANRGNVPNRWINAPSDDPKSLSLQGAGFTPYGALIAFGSQPVEKWQALAAQYQKLGFQNLFLMTGISMGVKGQGWKDPNNDPTRTLLQDPATAGTGVDEPVNLFLGNTKWQASTIDQIKWVHEHQKRFLYLISPNSSGADFLTDSQKTVRILEAKGAVPDIYGVEYYRTGYDMTPETVPDASGAPVPANSVTGIAYWLIKHRDGSPNFADLWLQDGRGEASGRGVMAPALLSERQVARIEPGAATLRYTVNLTSHDRAIDYAPVVQAKLAEGAKAWQVAFAVDGRDVTDAVLKDGYVFAGKKILLPGTTRRLTVTLRRDPSAAAENLSLALLLRANPSSPVVRDTVELTTRPAPAPTQLAANLPVP